MSGAGHQETWQSARHNGSCRHGGAADAGPKQLAERRFQPACGTCHRGEQCLNQSFTPECTALAFVCWQQGGAGDVNTVNITLRWMHEQQTGRPTAHGAPSLLGCHPPQVPQPSLYTLLPPEVCAAASHAYDASHTLLTTSPINLRASWLAGAPVRGPALLATCRAAETQVGPF